MAELWAHGSSKLLAPSRSPCQVFVYCRLSARFRDNGCTCAVYRLTPLQSIVCALQHACNMQRPQTAGFQGFQGLSFGLVAPAFVDVTQVNGWSNHYSRAAHSPTTSITLSSAITYLKSTVHTDHKQTRETRSQAQPGSSPLPLSIKPPRPSGHYQFSDPPSPQLSPESLFIKSRPAVAASAV